MKMRRVWSSVKSAAPDSTQSAAATPSSGDLSAKSVK